MNPYRIYIYVSMYLRLWWKQRKRKQMTKREGLLFAKTLFHLIQRIDEYRTAQPFSDMGQWSIRVSASRTYLHVYVYSTAIEYIGYRSERGNARNNRKCACTYIYTYLWHWWSVGKLCYLIICIYMYIYKLCVTKETKYTRSRLCYN